MQAAAALRNLVSSGELIVAPGVYDALTAKLAQYFGFEVIYMTGFGTAASHGYPDVGLLSMSEMADNVRRISQSVDVPLIADADTGYGNFMNVYRTVREYERAGAAGIQLEDQTWPKRSGHMAGKEVIGAEEMVGKIKAAVDARTLADTYLVIRTDAYGTHGFEEAIRRGGMYIEAGADILFVEGVFSKEQIREVPRIFSSPCLINMAFLWKDIGLEELRKTGYAVAIYPPLMLQGAIAGAFRMCRALQEGTNRLEPEDMPFDHDQLNRFLGLDTFREVGKKSD